MIVNLLDQAGQKMHSFEYKHTHTHAQTFEMSFLAIGFSFYDFFLKESMPQKLQPTINGCLFWYIINT